MSNQEQQLVLKISNHLYTRIMNSRRTVYDYAVVSKETKVPISSIKPLAKQICNCLLASQSVLDIDIPDNNCFDIMMRA